MCLTYETILHYRYTDKQVNTKNTKYVKVIRVFERVIFYKHHSQLFRERSLDFFFYHQKVCIK